MTTLHLRRPYPPRGAGRLIGAAMALGLIVLLGQLPLGAPQAGIAPQPGGVDAAPALDASGTLGLLPPAERVTFWEARVAAGGSFLDLIHLADAYLDRSRATGAADDLQRAAAALDRAAETAPNPAQISVRRALVAFALHDFAGAMDRADAVLLESPTNLTALGVAGDARLEMGDVDGARERYQQLARLAPSPAAWSRLGRLAYLTGDLDGAIRLVSRAAAASRDEGAPDAVAFYQFQLGELRRIGGDQPEASAAYEAALSSLPDYVPALAGLAAVREATGHRSDAIRLLERATARLPQPELIAALGDLYALDGDSEAAARQYALVERIGEVGQATGSTYDRQLVLFAADHDRGLEAAVALARAELAVRPDVYGHDALAWALFKAGELQAAATEAEAAMALGTPDPRLAYHAGMIAAAQGRTDAARRLLSQALAAKAYLPAAQVPVAERALAALDGSS